MATNLGTLTLDLVTKIGSFIGPVQQAEKQVQSSFGKMREHVNTYGTAIAGTAATAVTALAGMAYQTANQAAELEKFAARAQTTTQEFQKMAVGAEALGIEGEALSDMLKDFNEKMGELTAVGAGGAVDFFEQIALKMEGGVPAAKALIKEMQTLSGPDALVKYVDTLEKAGVTQSEMSFYLESMASDLTDLYPLLANGGEGLRVYGDMAERAGIIMTDQTKEAALALKDQMFVLDLQMRGVKNQLMQAVIPAFVDIAEAFLGGSEQGLQFGSVADTIASGLRYVAKVAIGAAAAVNIMGKSIGGVAAIGGAIASGEFAQAKAIALTLKDDLSDTALAAAAQMDKITNGAGQAKAQQLRGIREISLANQSAGAGVDTLIEKQDKAAKAASNSAKAASTRAAAAHKAVKELTDAEIKLKEMQFAWEVSEHRLTEEKKLRYSYNIKEQEVKADKELTKQQKEIKQQALRERFTIELNELKIAQAQELLQIKQNWMSAADYAREYYAIVRQEALNTPGISTELLNARVRQADQEEGIAQYEEKDAVAEKYEARFGVQKTPYQEDMELLQDARTQMLLTEEEYFKQRQLLQATYGAQYGADFAGMMMGMVDSSSSAYQVLYGIQKAFNLASAIMNGYTAISAAWASAPFPGNLPAVAMATIETGVLQAGIEAVVPKGFAIGGYVSGPGSSTSDDIPAMLSNGEFVMKASTVKTIGPDVLDRINRTGSMPGGDTGVRITQTINFTESGANIDTQGQKQIAQSLNNAMDAWARRESRQGGLLHKLARG